MEVRIEHLTKTFVGRKGVKTTAVNDMNFTIPDGKLCGLLGPSGCGKSTTLYMIAGLHKPTDGHVWFGDEDVTNVAPENRGIGLVFQNYALYPHFSVAQNISFPLDNIRPKIDKAEKDAIVHEMARLVDIEPYLERKPKELSGGQQQRVAIARALAKSPRILLLDEPLSNLDARLRLQTREEIKRVQRETGITTVFVTHDQEEAMSISDFIVVMKFGIVQQIGEPQFVYDEPANLFVAKFLGSPAINVFEGEIKGGKLYVAGNLVDDGEVYQGEYERSWEEEVLMDKAEAIEKGLYVEEEKKNGFVKFFTETIPGIFKKKKKADAAADREPAPEGQVYVTVTKTEKVKDRKVNVAIRPEAFVLNNKDGRFMVDVDYVEHVGRDISVIGKVKDQENSHLKIIIPSEERDNVHDGDKSRFDAKRFYVFEENGERIK